MRNSWFPATIFALVLGCGSSEPPKTFSDDDAKLQATALIPGSTVVSVERQTPAGEPALVVVKLKLVNAAVIAAEYAASDGSLFGLASETAPFEGYDVAPRANVLKYSQAKAKALETKPGTIEVWEFAATESIWEFYVRDASKKLWEIKMGAADGKVTGVAEKIAPD